MGFYTDLAVPLTRSIMDRLYSDELPYTARNNACMDKMNCCKKPLLRNKKHGLCCCAVPLLLGTTFCLSPTANAFACKL